MSCTQLVKRSLLLAGLAVATSSSPAIAGSTNEATPENVQAFRAGLEVILDDSDYVFDASNFSYGTSKVGEARLVLDSFSDDDLATVFASTGVPDLAEADGALLEWVEAMPGLGGVATLSATSSSTLLATDPVYGLTGEGLPDADSIFYACEDIVHDSEAIFIGQNVAAALRVVALIANRACELEVVGNSLPAACIPTDLLADAAQQFVDLTSFCAGEEDGVLIEGSYERVGFIYDEMVDGVNNGQSLALRLSIERALASNRVMGMFVLPEAHGGRLEVVREIVVEIIDNASSAGLSVTTSSRELATGDTASARGDYRTAYKNYSLAYRHAAGG